ncbi:type I toxin-antitoxin system Fst family toxin [Enterococcus faecalis]|nr:type I toxin-antitoxin system Fst family toxin [Enterococcus faecalis]
MDSIICFFVGLVIELVAHWLDEKDDN